MTCFQKAVTDLGLDVYVHSTNKFKTVMVQLFFDRPFDDHYSQFALLPHVLKRGSVAYPDSLALERRFDQLYGAGFGVSVHRLGERHVAELQLELADEALLPTHEPLLASGLETLRDILQRPVTLASGFLPDYVQQEKEAQIRAIESLYNDKAEYARQRCLQKMFAGDPFARLPIGEAEQVAAIEPAGLWQFYQRVLREANFQVFITGNIKLEQIVELFGQVFTKPFGAARQSPEPSVLPARRSATELTEEQPVAQGKLVLAYRSGISRRDPLFLPLLIYNGLLGGFGHSKLFQNVRERASLAYDCSSDVVASKGVLLIEAGISMRELQAARSIIDQQTAALARGEWSDEEWEKTVLALQSGLRGLADRPARQALTHCDRMANGITCSSEAMMQELCLVTRQQVLDVARRLELDTAYFLHGTAADEESSECN